MSQTTAIAAVTITLRDMLQGALASIGGEGSPLTDVLVTALPVDRARSVHHRRQLNLSLATVERDWQVARAWLFDALSRRPQDDS